MRRAGDMRICRLHGWATSLHGTHHAAKRVWPRTEAVESEWEPHTRPFAGVRDAAVGSREEDLIGAWPRLRPRDAASDEGGP